MLTPEQQALRKGRLTASRIGVLMTADSAGILKLYKELIGEEEPEDLSQVWAVQLGTATEPLNLSWYAMKVNPVSRRGEVVVHPDYDWGACTLDAWDDVLGCCVEAKHCSGREPLPVIIERYQPQCQWLASCTRASQTAISIIIGVSAPIVEYIPFDPEYCAEMIRRGEQFMAAVKARRVPVALDPVAAPIIAEMTYDMASNNVWADSAAEWLATRPFADRCEAASKILKAAVPADAKKAHGCGVQITRDRSNRLSLREART